MSRHRVVSLALVPVAFVLVAGALPLAAPRPAAASVVGAYIPPVSPPLAVITDHFRPPDGPYAAGNRGIDYATVPGSPVVASAAGTVIFAGPVAGALHVTIAHADGLRTSYSFLSQLLVAVGAHVDQGQPIGLTGPTFHFGVRDAAGDYLDPEALFAGHLGAHLVAGPDEGADPIGSGVDGERRSLAAVVAGAVGRFAQGSRAMAREALALVPAVSAYRLASELDQFARSQRSCTRAGRVLPTPSRRRVAILVGGLGSSDRSAAIDRLDTRALGYAPSDVIRFSYAGGRVPGGAAARGPGSALDATPYGPADTETDVRVTAARLAQVVEQVAQVAPGVPIDVMAHSEGGVLARLAIERLAADGRASSLGLVVTIATPHQGADAATALSAIADTPAGQVLAEPVAAELGVGLDPHATALAQLSETSPIVADLGRPVPAGIHVVSIGASGDLTVPWVRTPTPGATTVLVHLVGLHVHDALPGDPATTQAIALARAGLPPACLPVAVGVADVVASHEIAQAEDAFGLATAGAVGS